MKHYILTDDHQVLECDLMGWAKWFESTNRHVGNDKLVGGVNVSTVFLGLDHQYGDGPPLIFETMIFGGKHDGYQRRCSTWEQAEDMHKKAVRLVKGKA